MSLDEITHLADFRDLIVGATGLQAAVSRATWSARPSRECLVGPSACFAAPEAGGCSSVYERNDYRKRLMTLPAPRVSVI